MAITAGQLCRTHIGQLIEVATGYALMQGVLMEVSHRADSITEATIMQPGSEVPGLVHTTLRLAGWGEGSVPGDSPVTLMAATSSSERQ